MLRGILRASLLILAVLAACPVGCAEIRLKYATFNPLAALPEIPPALQSPAAPVGEDYYLVQFDGPVASSHKDALGRLGAEVLDYIPDFAFLVRCSADELEQARSLPNVRWAGPFHPAYRISPLLRGRQGTNAVNIVTFPGSDAAGLSKEIAGYGRVHRVSARAGGAVHVEAEIPAAGIGRVARYPGVAWVDLYVPHELSNDVARGLLSVTPVWSGAGLFGSGEIVAVSDTGLDTGNLSTISADFAGRVLKTYALGRNKKWDDPDGHGTHVAGSVLGCGALSGSNPSAHDYSTSFAGTAPEAQLVFQSVLDNAGGLRGIPSDLNDLFQPAYDDGARIHTNSWGAVLNGYYSTDSRNVDLFTWSNRDMTVVFSAGNQGVDANANGVVDPDSIDSPATAKNCITVGANESNRLSGGAQGTYGGYWPSDYPAEPIKSDKVSDNPSGIVAFSGRGPTNDGRIKPDVLAPGTNIISCRSHVDGAGTLWGVYNADYVYSGGTSMSTPLVAGICALTREHYRVAHSHSASSALVKASLINGGTDLYPGQYGTGSYLEIPSLRPNNVEGWGLVNAAYLISPPPTRESEFADNSAGLSTGEAATYEYDVAGASSPLRVTLVWTDYPAAVAASPALVNDLDLTITLPDASTLRGNGTTDRLNNVEGVDIAVLASGSYTVTVAAYNVPYGPQPFALVISGDLGMPLPTAVIDAPSEGTELYGPVEVRGSASGSGFQSYQLEYGAGASPTEWIPIGTAQYVPVTDGVLGVWETDGLPDGDYTIRLTVVGENGNSTDSALVSVLKTSLQQVKSSPDGTPVLLTGKVVSAGATDLAATLCVQEPDRTMGLRVSLGLLETGATRGDIVTISGTLQTADGERVVVDPTVVVTGRLPL